MGMPILTLYESEIDQAMATHDIETPWERLSPQNQRRLAVIILSRRHSDERSLAMADLLRRGGHGAQFQVIRDLTGRP